MSNQARANSESQSSMGNRIEKAHETQNDDKTMQDEPIRYEAVGLFDEEVEDVQMYNKGGLHPTHLGDILDGRFEVVHKLGSGGFGIVWLCHDTTTKKWRAVKVMSADHSSDGEISIYEYLRGKASAEQLEANHLAIPSESFWLDGPNGRHLCFVMPVLGYSIDRWRLRLDSTKEQTAALVQSGCRQIVQAVHFLHSNGICHSDLKPQNVLMKIHGLDEMDKEQVMELLDEPELIEVETVSGDPPQPRAPEYLVCALPSSWCYSLITDSVAIVDFGESFFANNPPKKPGHTPSYAAPEVYFEGSGEPGFSSDIWSLACTIFEIRDGNPLFNSLSTEGLYRCTRDLEFFLGALPEPFRTARSNMINAIVGLPSESDSGDLDSGSKSEESKSHDTEELDPVAYTREDLRRIRDKKIEGTSYSTVMEAVLGRERNRRILPDDDDEEEIFIKYRFPQEGVIQLSKLLEKMLKYHPSERITIDQVLEDPWISPQPSFPSTPKSSARRDIHLFLSIFTTALIVSIALAVS
ncbi:kinase-like protein [Nemania abortiva]|nr:kinase-like protein [Nemania abortiva]